MKFILMMTGKRADWEEYTKWSKEDMERNVAFMRAFNQELKDSGVFVSTEGLAWPGPEQAYKIAARVSAAPGLGGKPGSVPVEVRHVLTGHADLGL